MQNERKRILDMLENGVINAEEALLLLENLGKDQQAKNAQLPTEQPKRQSAQEEPKTDFGGTSYNGNESKTGSKDEDFFEDIRRDFNQFGDRFMQFVQSAVEKVKGFDFDRPFGEPVEFHHSVTKDFSNFNEISVDIANGKLELYPSEENGVRAECHVKAYRQSSPEEAKKEFLEKFLFVEDGQKLRLVNDMKMFQTNVVLYVPHKDYEAFNGRLFNGAFKLSELKIDRLKVKTANGKIEVRGLNFKDADFETANGSVQLQEVTGEQLEVETLNGRVYVDGNVKEVEAQSINGHVVVTTKDTSARKIDARAVAGSVELYIPSGVPINGEIASNFGKMDLQLTDITRVNESEQFLQKSIKFSKDGEGTPLVVFGEAKTGSVLVRYS
ncbi:DUF4097 domain-containing protein [Chungangia koreensis]|uniref:DUF4097 domain-containing protein n=1 Tax=Chungangia koreensis TaxID=752657 RepID=A0ABV8XAU3_9LACT